MAKCLEERGARYEIATSYRYAHSVDLSMPIVYVTFKKTEKGGLIVLPEMRFEERGDRTPSFNYRRIMQLAGREVQLGECPLFSADDGTLEYYIQTALIDAKNKSPENAWIGTLIREHEGTPKIVANLSLFDDDKEDVEYINVPIRERDLDRFDFTKFQKQLAGRRR